MGDRRNDPLRVDFDRQLKLEFHGSTVTSDAGLLAYRELDDALDLTSTAASGLHDTRTGLNTQHSLVALLRQSIYSRLGCGWGRRVPIENEVRRFRFTPTRVGKTERPQLSDPSLPVHPHACGEDCTPVDVSPRMSGSPPRVWGRRRGLVQKPLALRFTPTRVGKTDSCNSCRRGPSVHPHACGEDISQGLRRSAINGSPPRVWGRREHEA